MGGMPSFYPVESMVHDLFTTHSQSSQTKTRDSFEAAAGSSKLSEVGFQSVGITRTNKANKDDIWGNIEVGVGWVWASLPPF